MRIPTLIVTNLVTLTVNAAAQECTPEHLNCNSLHTLASRNDVHAGILAPTPALALAGGHDPRGRCATLHITPNWVALAFSVAVSSDVLCLRRVLHGSSAYVIYSGGWLARMRFLRWHAGGFAFSPPGHRYAAARRARIACFPFVCTAHPHALRPPAARPRQGSSFSGTMTLRGRTADTFSCCAVRWQL